MHFLITAGGTREYIDPVRFISNASSGKMGYALSREALAAGHKVTLISAPTNLRPPAKIRLISVETSAEMLAAVKKYFPNSDCLIMAAAVSDYKVAKPAESKLKKIKKDLIIKLKPTIDILEWAGRNKYRHKEKGRVVVGFALEDRDLRASAEKKMKAKNLDMIIANSLAAIGTEKSTVHIKTPDTGWTKIENATKASIAKKIIIQTDRLYRNS